MLPKWTDGRDTRDVVSEFIKPNDRLTSFERLEIYNRQYWFRLIDILTEDFPGLRAVLGEEKFYLLLRAYLTKYPSKSFSLREFGSSLPKFLEEEPQWAGDGGWRWIWPASNAARHWRLMKCVSLDRRNR